MEIYSLMRWISLLRQLRSSLSIPSVYPGGPHSVVYILKSSSVPKLEVTLRSSKECYFFFFPLGYSRLTDNVVSFRWIAKGLSHKYTHIQTPLSSSLPHNNGQSSMCYTTGPWLSTLNIVLCTCPSQTP